MYKDMRKLYEVLFYCGNRLFPAYYFIDGIEGETLENGLKNKLASITQRVREVFHLGDDIPDWKICKTFSGLKEDGLISLKDIV